MRLTKDDDVQIDEVCRVIAETGGNAMLTARRLGVSHRTVMRWLSSCGESREAFVVARAHQPSKSIDELLLQLPEHGQLYLGRDERGWACSVEAGTVFRAASPARAIAAALQKLRT
jgi:hypothetical protein